MRRNVVSYLTIVLYSDVLARFSSFADSSICRKRSSLFPYELLILALSMTLREDILEEYGPYCPPNRGRALRHYYHECSHHFMFSFWRTKISDLTEFGSHMLYLSLLWYLSMAFAALLAMLGLPLIVAYSAKGNFFANGVLRKATLGNYGPIYVEGALRAGGVVRSESSSYPLSLHWRELHVYQCFSKCLGAQGRRGWASRWVLGRYQL